MNGLIDTRTTTYKNGQYVPRNKNQQRGRTFDRKNKRKKNLLKTNQSQYSSTQSDNQHKRHKSIHNNNKNNKNNNINSANKKFFELLEQDNLIGDKKGISVDELEILSLESKLGIKSSDNQKHIKKSQKLARELVDDGLGELLDLCDEYEDKGLLKATAFRMKQYKNALNPDDGNDDGSSDSDSDNDIIQPEEDQDYELHSDSDNDNNTDDGNDEERALLARLAEIRRNKQNKLNQLTNTNDNDSRSELDEIDDEPDYQNSADNNDIDNDVASDDAKPYIKPSYDELYGFNAPTPQSLLEFKGLADNINSGAGANNSVANRYVPPHLRAQQSNTANDQLIHSIHGLLNKLGDSNIESILLDIHKLYTQHSRHGVNTILCNTILHNLNNSTQLLTPLCVLYSAIITELHMVHGVTTGSLFIENIVLKFIELTKQSSSNTHDELSDKSVSNILLLISYMFNFTLVNAVFITDIINYILSSNQSIESTVEYILVILQHCGYQLRRTNAVQLKHIVLSIQSYITQSGTDSNTRVQYMVELINNIKNNKRSADTYLDTIEHIKTLITNLARKQKSSTITNYSVEITLNDYLNIQSVGRWWLTGASYNEQQHNDNNHNNNKSTATSAHDILAHKLQLTSSNKKLLFTVLTESVDLDDCYNKLITLKTNHTDIVTLIFRCFANELVYNKFYELLLIRLMNYNTVYLKLVYSYLVEYCHQLHTNNNMTQITNTVQLCSHLLIQTKLQISFINNVDFIQLNDSAVLLLYQLLNELCQLCDHKQLKYIFNLYNLKHEYNSIKLGLIRFIRKYCFAQITDDSIIQQLRYIEHILKQDTVERSKTRKQKQSSDEYDILV